MRVPKDTPRGNVHPDGFRLIRAEHVPSLNVELQEYRHGATGARHFHIAAEDTNNAFLVAFLTVPWDSTGVAHILEHTTLCGSERYPVRDPFFMMLRRSLATFMNAFTGSDWTAYPFASQNRKDFDNLLRVYLDAVFFPRLDPLDFAQEGHRVELDVPGDPSSPLVYKGVVFNEMKGAMSSPIEALAHALHAHVFPTITYHYNSGGDPERIPDLTYEQLKAFHARHYHPSNAVLMTYGDMPAAEHQARFEECALKRFRAEPIDLHIPDERRYARSITVEASYALDGEEDTRDKTHIVLGWLLGKSADLREVMEARLLSGVLLDNSASPLRRALETSPLGTAPSQLCGLDDSLRESTFACGLEGSNPEHAQAVEDLVLEVLSEVAEQGADEGQVQAVLHQIELAQREITGGHFPYGLHLMVKIMNPILHGGDPFAALDIDRVLADLREAIRDPAYIKGLVRQLLLDNPHRVRLTMMPDKTLSVRRARAEAERLAVLKAGMSAAELCRAIDTAATLQARQLAEPNPEVLPKVTVADVPPELKIARGESVRIGAMPGAWYAQSTNGMVYQQIVVDLPDLSDELIGALPLFNACLTEVGCGGRDYLETQAWQAAVSGGISARVSLRGDVADVQRTRGVFVLAGKGLVRNQAALTELLHETFRAARFDELPRLRELVSQIRAQEESSVTDHGHALAMAAACAGMSPSGALSHRWNGLLGVRSLKALDDALEDPSALARFAASLEQLRDIIVDSPRQYLLVGEQAQREAMLAALTASWAAMPEPSGMAAAFSPAPVSAIVRQAWSTSTQVNFSAKAYPAVPAEHPDAPALAVLGDFLHNGYLHRAIREQGGAYGSGASYSSDTGAFRFYSYRDPRLTETLADFDRALSWLHETRHEPRALEEAILSVVGRIDRPDSPAGEAVSAFFETLHGRTPEHRQRFRKQVLEVSIEDLLRAAELYLRPERASVAVVSDPATLKQHDALGLELHQL